MDNSLIMTFTQDYNNCVHVIYNDIFFTNNDFEGALNL